MSQLINIALVSTNQNKFSETFIHNHLKCLEGNVHFLFDGYLPLKYSKDKGLSYSRFLKSSRFLRIFLKNNQDTDRQKLSQKIKKYLLVNKIQIVFCEYGPSGVEMMEIANACGIPLIVHFHGYDAYRMDILSTYGKAYTLLFANAIGVIAVSKHMVKQLQILNCPSDKLHLLNYGVDLKLFKQVTDQENQYDFIFCGRFVDKKGPKQIIVAFYVLQQQLPQIKMCMIGDGYLLQECKLMVSQLKMDNHIEFAGVLSANEVAAKLTQSKIFLLFSNITSDNDSEGMPISILEAGACGLAVISTFHAGISELIENNVNGLLVQENDEEALVSAMSKLLADKALTLQLGENLRLKIVKEYSIETNITRLNEIIRNSVKLDS